MHDFRRDAGLDMILGIRTLYFHKQRYHQTADLEAEAVTKTREPHHTCTGPSLHLFLTGMSAKGKIDWKEFEGEFNCQQRAGINSPNPFICGSRKKQLHELSHPTLLLI